jgi:predicted TPR repeat methyltransferase
MMVENISYRESHKREGKGKDYDAHYSEMPHRRFLWEREQLVLSNILKTYFKGHEIHLLDFACGTGRITSFLESKVTTSVGVDVSDAMLEEARKKLPNTKLIKADILRDNILTGRKFNLITAFRFFLNAEPELRHAALRALVPLLEKDGCFVFNNHRNINSPLIRLQSRQKKGNLNYMTIKNMHDLVNSVGLEIVRIYPIGLLQIFRSKMPINLKHIIENITTKFPFLRNYSESPIAVCQFSSYHTRNR